MNLSSILPRLIVYKLYDSNVFGFLLCVYVLGTTTCGVGIQKVYKRDRWACHMHTQSNFASFLYISDNKVYTYNIFVYVNEILFDI